MNRPPVSSTSTIIPCYTSITIIPYSTSTSTCCSCPFSPSIVLSSSTSTTSSSSFPPLRPSHLRHLQASVSHGEVVVE
ncbi:hypothetical protein Pmani_022114 [Petrolisthes manimaculis]|uniref:Uncharacterized protein n=1 Tax=Petrolisthes manimaculis TaxID=1843537 RepID=A0AAE1PDJ8_9EUCA|nr:hypothetical protein Pmani_022114 [Petrolisthes manimaculis]